VSRFHSLSVYSHALVLTLWGKPSLRAASILTFILSRIGLDSSWRKACRASSVNPALARHPIDSEELVHQLNKPGQLNFAVKTDPDRSDMLHAKPVIFEPNAVS
jgi:hypothetical protein